MHTLTIANTCQCPFRIYVCTSVSEQVVLHRKICTAQKKLLNALLWPGILQPCRGHPSCNLEKSDIMVHHASFRSSYQEDFGDHDSRRQTNLGAWNPATESIADMLNVPRQPGAASGYVRSARRAADAGLRVGLGGRPKTLPSAGPQ